MNVISHGIDLVEIARIGRMVDDHADRFIERCYTPREVLYADAAPRKRLERLAGRFAAKEAILKAIGTGWRDGIAWTDMEILPDTLGRPVLTLSGTAADLAAKAGIGAWTISISHTDTLAIASAIALSLQPDKVL